VFAYFPKVQNPMGKTVKNPSYLKTFFEEKNLPYAVWNIEDKNGTTHVIDNDVVIEAILNAPKNEQVAIANMLHNHLFHHYLD